MKCAKLNHRSPAAARKWLRRAGRRPDAKYLYRCARHGSELVFHYTRRKPQ